MNSLAQQNGAGALHDSVTALCEINAALDAAHMSEVAADRVAPDDLLELPGWAGAVID